MSEQQDLEKAIAVIRAGDMAGGKRLLVAVLKANPRNELAWLWLVRILPDDQQRMAALEQCLKVNPKSESARRALEQLQLRQGAANRPEATPVEKPQPPIQPPPAPVEKRPIQAQPTPPSLNPLADRLSGRGKPTRPLPSIPQVGLDVPSRPVPAVLESKPVSRPKTQRKKKRARSLNLLEIGMILLVLAAVAVLVLAFINQSQITRIDLAHQARQATAGVLQTENARLQGQVSERQTQAAASPTPSPTPTPTVTPRPSPTPTPSKTPVPAKPGASSLLSPENAAALILRAEWPGVFYADLLFSPAGDLLAVASEQRVNLWGMDSLAVRRQIFLEDQAESLAFSPDGEVLFFTQAGLEAGSYLFSTSSTSAEPVENLLTGVAFPDTVLELFFPPGFESLVMVASANNANILLVDPADGHIVDSLDHTGGVLAAAMHPEQGLLATGGGNDLVQVWNLPERRIHTVLSGHSADITALAFSPDGLLLASAAQDGEIRIWNTENWDLAAVLAGHPVAVLALAFSPDHRLLAAGDAQDQLILWNVDTNAPEVTLAAPVGIKKLLFAPDGGLLAAAGSEILALWAQPAP
jgi:hypothetical protein